MKATYILEVGELGENMTFATLEEAEEQREFDIESAIEMGYTREEAEEMIEVMIESE